MQQSCCTSLLIRFFADYSHVIDSEAKTIITIPDHPKKMMMKIPIKVNWRDNDNGGDLNGDGDDESRGQSAFLRVAGGRQ